MILCQEGQGRRALQRLRELMGGLKLTVNEEKTRICRIPEGSSTSWGTRWANVSGENRPGPPGTPAIEEEHQGVVEAVHELTARPGTWQDTTKLVGKLNRRCADGRTTAK